MATPRQMSENIKLQMDRSFYDNPAAGELIENVLFFGFWIVLICIVFASIVNEWSKFIERRQYKKSSNKNNMDNDREHYCE